jgi:DNA modification methylase
VTFNRIIPGNSIDTLKTLPDCSVDCCVTSPPYYGLRDYNVKGQIGLEKNLIEYVQHLIEIFHEVKRILRDDGTLWLIIGDIYAGSNKGGAKYPKDAGNFKKGTNRGMIGQSKCTEVSWDKCKNKDLVGIPWMLAFALRADGWYLRQDIIWHKPNPIPESITDRCTKSHEYIFLLSKSANYFYNHNSIKEPAVTTPKARNKHSENYQADYAKGNRFSPGLRVYGKDNLRNKRDVWTVSTKANTYIHFATFPEELITPCILAGSREGGIILDPFMGSGTTAVVAIKNFRKYIGCEINPEYIKIADKRIKNAGVIKGRKIYYE